MEFTDNTVAKALVNLTERVEALEAKAEEQESVIEELRYSGHVHPPSREYIEYRDLLDGEWDYPYDD